MLGPLFDVQMSFRVAGARDCAPCQTWAKRGGFCSMSKNGGRRGTFEEDLQRCIFCGRRTTRDMFIRDVRRSGRWFPERVAFWSIRSSGLLRWFWVTGAALRMTWHQFFRGRGNILETQIGKIAKRICTRPSALHSTFHFWRTSRRILSFLLLSTSENEEVSQNCFVFLTLSSWNIEEVSQNCFVFDVVIFEKWRSLAE